MTLHWQEVGPRNAPTIVFLHGLGVSSWMWVEQMQALQTIYHCLTIDLPGNGKSKQVKWESLADSARQVADLIRAHATDGKAHLVGLSLGGYVAVTLLEQYPDVVKSVLVTGINTSPLKLSWLMKGAMAVLPRLMQYEWFIRQQARMLQIPAEVLPLFIEDNKALTLDIYQRVYDEVFAFQLSPILAERSQPFLAVAGDKEVEAVKNGLTTVLRTIPHATARIVPNAHHAWSGEYPGLFTEMVQAWIEQKPLPTTLIEVSPTQALIPTP
jgi:pimeloyl-ACP methyl ester carboxylesterase